MHACMHYGPNTKLKSKAMHKTASKILKGAGPAPMGFLKRNEAEGLNGPPGTFTTHPAEIDVILHLTWDTITNGISSDRIAGASSIIENSPRMNLCPCMSYKLNGT